MKTEIIIINDGSTDNSLEIVKTISENQANIIVFSQKNSDYESLKFNHWILS